MPSRAAQLRQRVAQRHPDATVSRRGKKFIEFDLPDGKKKLIASVRELHHDDGREIDTDWAPSAGPFDHTVEIDGAELRIREDVAAAPVVEFVHLASGESVNFYPHALRWTNDLGQLEQVGMPTGSTTPVDNAVRWQDAYGPGLDFSYFPHPTRLIKHLTIDSLAALGSPPQFIVDGGNPQLELNFGLNFSRGVDLFIDGEKWNGRTATDTQAHVEGRLSDGTVVFALLAPTYWDEGLVPEGGLPVEPGSGSMRFKKQGPNLFVSVRVPWSWLQAAHYPVVVDPTTTPAVGASGDDGKAYSSSDSVFDHGFDTSATGTQLGSWGFTRYAGFMRFSTVAIPTGATIDSVTWVAEVNYTNSVSSSCESTQKFAFHATADAAAPTTGSQFNDDIQNDLTSAKSGDYCISSGNGWGSVGNTITSPTGLDSSLQEVIDSGGWAENDALILYHYWVSNTSNANPSYAAYDHATRPAPELEIDYTSGSTQYNQAVDATSTVTPVITRTTNKTQSVSSSISVAIAKQVTKALAAVSTITGAATKRVNKALSTSSTLTAALEKTRLFLQSLDVAPTISAALTKGVDKTLAVGSAVTAATTKVVTTTLATGSTLTAALIKQAKKILNKTTVLTPGLVATKVILLTLEATTTVSAAISRVVSYVQNLNVTFTMTPSLTWTAMYKQLLAVSSTLTTGLTKLIDKTFAVSAGISAAVNKGLSMLLEATTTLTAELVEKATYPVTIAASTVISAALSAIDLGAYTGKKVLAAIAKYWDMLRSGGE